MGRTIATCFRIVTWISSILFTCIVATSAIADENSSIGKHTSVQWLLPSRYFAPDTEYELGINITLDEGWHIYWQNPGETGLPPKIQWRLDVGKDWEFSSLQHPAPIILTLGGMKSFVHGGGSYTVATR